MPHIVRSSGQRVPACARGKRRLSQRLLFPCPGLHGTNVGTAGKTVDFRSLAPLGILESAERGGESGHPSLDDCSDGFGQGGIKLVRLL
jgi:hypothetical protein